MIEASLLKKRLVIMGSGGHAKVVIEAFREDDQVQIVGVLSVNVEERNILGVPILGTDDLLSALRNDGVELCFAAIGDNDLRKRAAGRAIGEGFALANAFSKGASVSPSARFGTGILVAAGAVINADTRIDDMAIINTGASVDHDCHVGEAAHIAPGAVICGSVIVGAEAMVGAGATVIPGLSIGAGARIAAGACVVRSVPSKALARGVPARNFHV
jgi:UDP-perosamine 4-acetyltransferase